MKQPTLSLFPRRDPADLGFDVGRLARVNEVVQRALDANQCAGAVVGIVRDGALVWLSTHGARDLSIEAPMMEDTLFRIYSMSKPITSTAVMMLFEEAALRLTDPLSRFLPDFGQMEVYVAGDEPPFRTEPATREITIRDLLTHTGGLGYGIGDPHPVEEQLTREVWDTVDRNPEVTLLEAASAIASCPLVHQPGTHWRYSVATDLLGAVVEVVSGQSLDAFLKERIFDPLGMTDTFFTVPEERRERLAVCYTPGENGLDPAPDTPRMGFTRPTRHPSGGGGLVSTAGDYLAFMQMLLSKGRATVRTGKPGDRLLGARTVTMMMTDHLPPGVGGWEDRPGYGFGYGGRIVTDATQLSPYGSQGQFAWGGAASTIFFVDPAERLAVVVLQQVVPGFVYLLTEDIGTAVYQAIVD